MKKKKIITSTIFIAIIVVLTYMVIRNTSVSNKNMHLYLDSVVEYDTNFVEIDEQTIPTEFIELNNDIYYLEYDYFNDLTRVKKINFDSKEKITYLELSQYRKNPLSWYILASKTSLYLINYNDDETYYIVEKNDEVERFTSSQISSNCALLVDVQTNTLYYMDDNRLYYFSTRELVANLNKDSQLLEVVVNNNKVITRYSSGVYLDDNLIVEYYKDIEVNNNKLHILYDQDQKTIVKTINLEDNSVNEFSITSYQYQNFSANGNFLYLINNENLIYRINTNKKKIDKKINILTKKNVVYNYENIIFTNENDFLLPAKKIDSNKVIIQLYW